MDHPAPRGTPLVKLQRAGLLEDVDHRVRVTAQAEQAAGLREVPKRADAVAKVTLCGRAGADGDAVRPEQADVVVVDMDRMDGGQVRAKDTLALQ